MLVLWLELLLLLLWIVGHEDAVDKVVVGDQDVVPIRRRRKFVVWKMLLLVSVRTSVHPHECLVIARPQVSGSWRSVVSRGEE